MVIVIEGLIIVLFFIIDVGVGDMIEFEIILIVLFGKGMDDGDWDEKDEMVMFLVIFDIDEVIVIEEFLIIDVEENIIFVFDGCCVGFFFKEVSEDGWLIFVVVDEVFIFEV